MSAPPAKPETLPLQPQTPAHPIGSPTFMPEDPETIDETVSNAIRALRQDAMARDLAAELTEVETAWLDADAG